MKKYRIASNVITGATSKVQPEKILQNGRVIRKDGYANILTKYGTSQDNTEAYSYVPEAIIPDIELCRHYESNGLFAKIIDRPATEALKHGFTLKLNDPGLEVFFKDVLDELDWDTQAATAIKWARLFGGSIMVMMIDDGRDINQPIDWNNIRDIDELRVYERAIVQPDYASMYSYSEDDFNRNRPTSFGKPKYYNVNSLYGTFRVHAERCLVFRNGTLPEKVSNMEYHIWGMPEYMRIKAAMRDTILAHGNGIKLLDRAVQAIYKMKDLAKLLQTDEGEDMVLRRLRMIDMARGILNSMAIDSEGEEYEFKTVQFTGVKDIIESSCNYLSAITDIPQTVLFGRSPAGQNSTGESDLENWYNKLDSIRTQMIKHNLNTLLDVISYAGKSQGKLNDIPKLKIQFESLWSLSETEQATVDQTKANTAMLKAQTAQLYVDMNAMDPTEIRRGLAKTEEFNIEEVLDDLDEPDLNDLDLDGTIGDLLPPQEETNVDADESVRFSAAAVIVTDGKRILVADRKDGGGVCGPGGHRESGETPLDTVLRETMEEFGLQINNPIELGQADLSVDGYGAPVFFLCSDFEGSPQADGNEMENARFVPITDLLTLNLFPPFRKSLEILVKQNE